MTSKTTTPATERPKNLIQQAQQLIEDNCDLYDTYGKNWHLYLEEKSMQVIENARTAFRDWQQLIKDRGRRYADCSLGNFEIRLPEQQSAIDELNAYCEEIDKHVYRGRGLILFGPKGTGKDHCLMACARAALSWGHQVRWQNGCEFFRQLRDRITNQETEDDIKARLVRPYVLWISDPVPPGGKLTEKDSDHFFEIVDRRYNMLRPTWISMNVVDGDDAARRIGGATVDRLKDGAKTLHFNWESYRAFMQ